MRTTMPASKAEVGGKRAQCMTTKATAMSAANSSEAQPGGQGRIKDPVQDRRLARNRALKSLGASRQGLPESGEIAAAVSAYLEGNLAGAQPAPFEAIFDEVLSQELAQMRRLNDQLKEIGAEILAEPIPDFLLEALTPLPSPMTAGPDRIS
jgi:transposase